MTIVEAAIRLNINYDFCLRLVRQGKIKARKRGREWFVSAEAVRERMDYVARYRAEMARNRKGGG